MNQKSRVKDTALISFADNLTDCTLLQSKLASYTVSDQKNQKLFKAVHLFHCVSVGSFAYDHNNHHKWVTLGIIKAIEGHFRHKSQICVRVWVFFVSYPNGKGVQGKGFRFGFQRSENCYPFFFFCQKVCPHCTRVQKTEDKVEYKIQLYFVFDNILYYIVPRLGPSLVVCTTTFGCCAWWPFELIS